MPSLCLSKATRSFEIENTLQWVFAFLDYNDIFVQLISATNDSRFTFVNSETVFFRFAYPK